MRQGDNLTLTCHAEGSKHLEFRWQKVQLPKPDGLQWVSLASWSLTLDWLMSPAFPLTGFLEGPAEPLVKTGVVERSDS